MATVQQILNQQDNYSQLSIDASFTLQDILQQPPDQDLQHFDNLQQIDDIDAMFQDDQQPISTPSINKINSNHDHGSSKEILTQSKIQNINTQNENKQIVKFNFVDKNNKSQSGRNLTAKRGVRLANLSMPAMQKIRNMVYISLKNVSQLFDIANSQSKGVGVATCISSSGNKFLALGTSIGNIVIFQIGVKGHRLLSTPDQNKYGQVTSVSVSRDNRYLVAGYETGLVILWDLYNFKVVKPILLQKNRILKVLFCSQNFQNFVSSDSEGYLYMYTIQNYLWTGVRTQLLIDKSDNVYYDIKYSKVKSGRQILALSTLNSVLLVILKPTVTILGSIERPQGVSNNKIPNCEIGQGQQKRGQVSQSERVSVNSQKSQTNQVQEYIKNKQDYLCVSWGRLIYIYNLVYSNTQIQKIENDFIIEQPSGVHNMQFITNGILVTLDSRQVYRVINLAQQKQKIKQGQKKTLCSCISVNQLTAETIYQRCLKDKEGRYIKSYSNTIVSCCHNPRYKQIFFISKNAVYRGRLQKWTDYIHYLLTEQKNWQLALKICLQLYKGNYNIFTQKFIVNKTSLNLLCEIGRIFFKERMKQIQKKRTQLNSIHQVIEQVREMFQITIQYFCTIDCEDLMFGSIYKDLMEKYFFQYEELFIECLKPFIQQSILNKIMNRQIFIRIVDAYAKKPELLNKFIIALHQDSLYFQDIVQICTRQKLFQSLSYICSVNGDFISPANKLITHLQQHPNDKVQYCNLKEYLNNLIEYKYPNGKPITKKKDTMLRDLSIWLVCDQTLQYMVKNYEEDYFIMLTKLGQKLLQNQQINQIPTIAQQVMSKIDIIKQFKLQPKVIQFIMKIGLAKQIHFSQALIKDVLNICVQIFQKYSTSELRKQFKYITILTFLEKYLLDKHFNIKQIREEFQNKLIPKLNIWIRLTYKLLAQVDRQELFKQSPELLRNQDPGRDSALGYLFENSDKYQEIIRNYEDLLIQWSPEQSLLYIIQSNKSNSIKQINTNVMKISDEKLRYAVIRKILRLLRVKNKQSLTQPNKFVGKIFKESIRQLKIPQILPLANKILETTLSDQILLFYLVSICKYKKQKRVFYELTQNQDQYRSIANDLMPIMKQYGYTSCMGFIYQQQNKLKQAFDEYKQVYQEYFEENFRKFISHQYCHGRFMLRIFHIMLDLCFRIKIQQQWAILISVILSPLQKQDFTNRAAKTRVIDTIQSIYEKKASRQHPFMQHLIDVIQLTLTSTSREVSINLMAIQLNKYTELLNKSFIVNCLTSTLKNCGKRVQTFQISKKLMVSEFVGEFQQFFQVNKVLGSCSDIICDECGLQASSRNYNPTIEQIKFQILKCGHGYHDTCFKKNYYKCKSCTRKAYGDAIQDEKSKDKLQKIINKTLVENEAQIKQIQIEPQRSEDIFRYLALEDYRKRQQLEFQAFVEQYEGYISSYKNV